MTDRLEEALGELRIALRRVGARSESNAPSPVIVSSVDVIGPPAEPPVPQAPVPDVPTSNPAHAPVPVHNSVPPAPALDDVVRHGRPSPEGPAKTSLWRRIRQWFAGKF